MAPLPVRALPLGLVIPLDDAALPPLAPALWPTLVPLPAPHRVRFTELLFIGLLAELLFIGLFTALLVEPGFVPAVPAPPVPVPEAPDVPVPVEPPAPAPAAPPAPPAPPPAARASPAVAMTRLAASAMPNTRCMSFSFEPR